MNRALATAVLLLAFSGGMVRGQLVRQANTTLSLPADLPSATGYSTENAIMTGSPPVGMTVSNPIATAFPPGETDRLLVAQRGGEIRVVRNLSTAPVQSVFINIANALPAAETLAPTSGTEYGLLSLAFHPNYAS